MVMQVDWTVGKIIKTLQQYNIEENTLIFYTSDNGSYMFRIDESTPDHMSDETVQGYHTEAHRSNERWRGTKADIYDGGHRIPFIVKWPKIVTPGASSEELICLTDIYSTIAQVMGSNYASDDGPDSYSILNILTEQEGFIRHPVVHHSVNGTFSLRLGEWKMIFSDGSGGRQKPVGKPFQKPYQLYNIISDPSETNNLIQAKPEIADQLEAVLNQIMNSPNSKNISPEL